MYTMEDLDPGDKIALYGYMINPPSEGLVEFKITEVYETWFKGYIEDYSDSDGEVMSFENCDAIAKAYF